jgi:hypothetical protein
MDKPEFSERAKRKYQRVMMQVMMQGYADVDCTNCGDSARVEPDGDYPCGACGVGRLTSPLVAGGLI